MNSFKKLRVEMTISSIICILLGVVLIFFPSTVNEMIAYVLAGAAFIVSIIGFYNYFTKNVQKNFYRNDLVYAVLALVIGIVLLIKKASIMELIPIVLGAFIIISGVKKLQNALDLIRLKQNGWKSILTLSIINTVFGIVLLCNASAALDVIARLIGVGLVFSGGSDLFSFIWVTKQAEKYSNPLDDNEELLEIDDTEEH